MPPHHPAPNTVPHGCQSSVFPPPPLISRDTQNRLFSALLVHLLAVLLWVAIHYFGVGLYQSWFGAIKREISLGILMWTLFWVFCLFNLLMALIPYLSIKLILVAIELLLTVWGYFPQNPIRGYVYCALIIALSAGAIYTSRLLHRHCNARDLACGLKEELRDET